MERGMGRSFGLFVSFVAFGLLTACGGGSGGSSGGTVVKTPTIYVQPATLDFGGVTVQSSQDKTFWVQNKGAADLTIGTIAQPGSPFSISSDTCSNSTLKQYQTCSVNLHFSPASQGLSGYTLSIPSNATNPGAGKISCSGEGYGLSVWINQVKTAGTCPSPEISTDVTVNDPIGSIGLTTLLLSNFKLSETGIPIDPAKITIMNNQASPVSVVLALDWSESVYNIVSELGTAAKSFIDLLGASDEAAVWKFNDTIVSYPTYPPSYFVASDASGKADLKTFIDTALPLVTGTRLYDAVFESVERAAQGSNSKRVVIVLSDGFEANGTTPSTIKTVDEVINNAKQKGIPVFTIFYTDPNYNGGGFGNPQILQRLADETGGKYYDSANADLAVIFQQISNVLSNKYTLKYRSSKCTGTFALDVRVDYNGLYGQDTRTVTFP